MSCADLTVLCITEGREHAADFILELGDITNDIDATCTIVEDYGVSAYIESALDHAIAKCHTPYILRIDDDERITPGMVEWLRAGAYREHDHWAFPRLNLWPDAEHYIVNEPLWPDLQTRLSVKEKSGGRDRIHAGSPFGTGAVAPVAIEHHKFLVRSREERQALMDRYESLQKGAGYGYAMFSLPELYEDDLVLGTVPR